MPVTFADDIRASLTANDFVAGLLGSATLSVVFGEPGSGKTFFVCDLALHVALGMTWNGRGVEQGAVLYLSLEGVFGINNRIAAFRQHHGIDSSIHLAVVPCVVDLRDPEADVESVITTARHVAQHFAPVPLRLIVIDTLARALGGGDENSPEDMGAVVRSADRIREAVGAHVMFIHHAGKDASKGARGHSSLRAAVDTEIEVTQNGASRLATVRKQRDLPTEGAFAFNLHPVELGLNDRGAAVTSCVVLSIDAEAAQTRRHKLTPAQKRAFAALQELIVRDGVVSIHGPEHVPAGHPVVSEDAWRAAAYSRSISAAETPSARRKAFQRACEGLQDAGVIGVFRGEIWIV